MKSDHALTSIDGVMNSLFRPPYPACPRNTRNKDTSRVSIGLISAEKLIARIAQGFGQGHREHYKPWLQVQRHETSPNSPMGHLPSPELGHTHHYRSRSERKPLLILKWLLPYDLRDQYPIWSWTHPHPLHGLPNCDDLPSAPGSKELLHGSGIHFASIPEATVCEVPTIDILATIGSPEIGFALRGYECKPKSRMEGPDNWRTLERLELSRRYLAAIGAGFQIIHEIPAELETLMVNLDAVRPAGTQRCVRLIRSSPIYPRFVALCNEHGYSCPICEVLARAAIELALPAALACRYLHTAIWWQDVDHDLRQPFETWCPFVRGGIKLRKQLREIWGITL